MDKEEYESYGDKVMDGYAYTSYTCEPRIYLPWLATKIIRKGGRIIKRKVVDLSEVKLTLIRSHCIWNTSQLLPMFEIYLPFLNDFFSNARLYEARRGEIICNPFFPLL